MIRICAWCGKKLGEKPPYEDRSITHEKCEECRAKWKEASDKRKAKVREEMGNCDGSQVSQSVLNGIIVVRETGKDNLLNPDTATKLCSEWGYWEAASWIREYKADYMAGVRDGFEVESG